MLDLVISPSLTVNRECPDRLKLNLSNIYATAPDDIEGRLPLPLTLLALTKCACICNPREEATCKPSASDS